MARRGPNRLRITSKAPRLAPRYQRLAEVIREQALTVDEIATRLGCAHKTAQNGLSELARWYEMEVSGTWGSGQLRYRILAPREVPITR